MRGNFSDSIKGRFVNAIFYFEIPCCFVCVLAILAGGILPGGLLLERALHLTQPQQPEKVPSAGRAPRTPYTATQTLLLPSWPRVLQVEPAVRSLWAAPARRITVLVVPSWRPRGTAAAAAAAAPVPCARRSCCIVPRRQLRHLRQMPHERQHVYVLA